MHLEKIYENGEFVYLEFKDLEDPEYSWIELANGNKCWFLNGKYHREDGPAVEYANGTKIWRLNGKLHREDGPAIEWANGAKRWYLNGKLLTEEDHRKQTKA